ncbi:hypothetical protein Mth01_32110 [Sphaerimonospora thailandensis]|uniref:Uncharacterized protein n=1 Tax=Sphaerimonospora thailandensis TaxID=795644 RepID=A0A8J3R9K8_9ACTN|nr:hypothetical protein Mth01_32110 [Sphaerimonospora thailandensis]
MQRHYRRGACIILSVTFAFVAGCSPSRKATPPPAVTEESAKKVLAEVIAGVAQKGVAGFCKDFAIGIGACSSILDQALEDCLMPGPPPVIKRSAAVPAIENRQGGWVLGLEGHTLDGQRYVSEFFVAMDKDRPRAHVGVYWTGLGLGDSPLGPDYTVVPQRACQG